MHTYLSRTYNQNSIYVQFKLYYVQLSIVTLNIYTTVLTTVHMSEYHDNKKE